MKIKFNTAGNLTLNKILKLHDFTIVARSVFEEDAKYFPQDFQMNVCISYKCQNVIGLMHLNDLMLIRQMHQKNVTFVIIGILKILVLNMNHIFAIVIIILCKKL